MARMTIRMENDARVCSGRAASATPPSRRATRIAGKGRLNLSGAHGGGVRAPAEVAAGEAERDADDHREDHRGEADQQRDAGAEQDRGQYAGALFVRAEQASHVAVRHPRGRHTRIQEIVGLQIVGVRRRDPRREQGAGEEEHAHERRQHGHGGGAEAVGETALPHRPWSRVSRSRSELAHSMTRRRGSTDR